MKPLKYLAEKKDNFKVIRASQMKEDLKNLPPGRYEITIKKEHRKASKEQFSYLYSVVYPIFLVAAYDAGYTTDDFKDIDELDVWCKLQFANRPIMNRETGEVINVPGRKSSFSTVEQIAYCNKLRDYASEYFGVYIPDPDPLWKLDKEVTL